jgi:hypothetical protein
LVTEAEEHVKMFSWFSKFITQHYKEKSIGGGGAYQCFLLFYVIFNLEKIV